MRRLVFLLGLLGVLAVAACGVRPSGVIPGGDAPSGQAATPVVFFVSGDALAPASRPTRGGDLLLQLAAGPDDAERAQGLRTELPGDITMSRDYSTVGAAPRVSVSVAPRTLSRLAIQQIVCTATTEPSGAPGGTAAGGPVTVIGAGESLEKQYCGFTGESQ